MHIQNRKFTPEEIEPLGYHILLEQLELEDVTDGGIVLTASHVNREQDAMNVGKVLKIGPFAFKNHSSGCNSAEDWGLAVGDYVQFPSHTFMPAAGEKSNLVFVIDYDIKAKVIINE